METGEVRDTLLRETIVLVFSVATIVIATKVLGGPDAFKAFRMRALLVAKRGAQSQADAWQGVANAAATSYQRARF